MDDERCLERGLRMDGPGKIFGRHENSDPIRAVVKNIGAGPPG